MYPLQKIAFFSIVVCLLVNCKEKEVFVDNFTTTFTPNILWLVCEDMSAYIPPFGDSTVQTPNLSRLAEEGVRYTNFYSISGVCAPSRFAIATGMYPSSVGAHHMRTYGNPDYMDSIGLIPYEAVLPPNARMMSEVLRQHGYYCTNNDKTDYQFRHPVTAWDESSPYAHWNGRAPDQPFFAVYNFGVTHESQVFWPTGIRNLRFRDFPPQRPDTILPWSVQIDSADWKLLVDPDLDVPVPPYLPDTEPVKNDIRRVYSNIVEMDRQVGNILIELERDGLLENTIIFWYTDHGGPLPRQKRLLYDSGIRVPMIIRFPGSWNAGETDDQLISFVDLAPTVFSLAGIQPPEYLQGQSFLGAYDSDESRSYIHAAADRFDMRYDMIRAVRDKRFKYLRNFYPERGYYLDIQYRENMVTMQELLRLRDEGKLNEFQAQWFRTSKPEEELFDTETDPHELNNLAQDPRYQDKLIELREECDRWMKEIQDKGLIPENELITILWPGWTQPETAPPSITNEDEFITISCDTPGASIGYRIEGAAESWSVYAGSFQLATGSYSLEVTAHRIGYKPSPIVTIVL